MPKSLLNRIRLPIIGRFLGVGFLLALAACDYATPDDKEALRKVQQQWGRKYEFKLSSEIYWSAQAKPDVTVDEAELRAALSAFGAHKRPSSPFVYLNAYDSTGRFVFQLYYDSNGDIAKEMKSEHY